MHKKKYVSVRSFNEHKVQKKTGGVEVLAQNRLSFAHRGFWDRFSTGARFFCFYARVKAYYTFAITIFLTSNSYLCSLIVKRSSSPTLWSRIAFPKGDM